MDSTMETVTFQEHGGLEKLFYEDVPLLYVCPDEVLETTRQMETDTLRPIVDSVFSRQDAYVAQEPMLARKFFGKIVLKVDQVA